MAKAEVKVKQVPVTTTRESRSVVLHLSEAEAYAVLAVVGGISGPWSGGKDSIRKYTGRVYTALSSALDSDTEGYYDASCEIFEHAPTAKAGGQAWFDTRDDA